MQEDNAMGEEPPSSDGNPPMEEGDDMEDEMENESEYCPECGAECESDTCPECGEENYAQGMPESLKKMIMAKKFSQ